MFYLIYVSFATKPPGEEPLRALLKQAQENNKESGITGMMVYKNGMYVQLLEGDEATVRGLFERVSGDPRHHDVNLIETGEAPDRCFPDWSMGFCNMESRGDLPDLNQYMDAVLATKDLRRDLPRAHRFLKAFSRIEGCGDVP